LWPVSEDNRHERFVRARTVLTHAPLVPEIALHLGRDPIDLWGESEALDAGPTSRPPPYWAFAWPGGQALARYILDHPGEVSGKTVLDFGSGSGLVAIAAAKAGASCACASEIDPLARSAMELNSAANGVFIEPLQTDIIGTDARWNVVLAGDMWYERELAERLTGWLDALAQAGAQVLIGDPGRSYFPVIAAGHSLTRLATYTVPTSRELEDRETREASVYALSAS
jgi:predicted nicotinamide N-methyase